MTKSGIWVENSIAIEFPDQRLGFTSEVRGCSTDQLYEAEARLRMHALCRKSDRCGILGEQEITFDFLQNDTHIFVGAVSVAQLLVAADSLRYTRKQRND